MRGQKEVLEAQRGLVGENGGRPWGRRLGRRPGQGTQPIAHPLHFARAQAPVPVPVEHFEDDCTKANVSKHRGKQ